MNFFGDAIVTMGRIFRNHLNIKINICDWIAFPGKPRQ